MTAITTPQQLRALYAPVGERSLRKQMPRLDAHCQRFISLSPLCVMATAGNASQMLDASPRGGCAGFVKVHDAQTLLLPDAGGNNRLDSLENLLHDPRIGLLFFIPGVDETLRINGLASLHDDADLKAVFAADKLLPKLVIRIEVQEAYLHCAKALMRSRLWHAQTQVARSVLPSMGQMMRDQIGPEFEAESQAEMLQRYAKQLAADAPPEAGA